MSKPFPHLFLELIIYGPRMVISLKPVIPILASLANNFTYLPCAENPSK
jgi:hypothetical protein